MPPQVQKPVNIIVRSNVSRTNRNIYPKVAGEAVSREAPCIVDDNVGLSEFRQLMFRGPYEHGVHEQRVVRPRADDAHLDTILQVPTGKPVETNGSGCCCLFQLLDYYENYLRCPCNCSIAS